MDGNFLQYIEGPAEKLDALMAVVRAAPRHSGLILLASETIAERAFPDWTIAFDLAKGSGDGQSAFLSDGLLNAVPDSLSPTARRLIEIFRERIR